ncbi:dolichyl-diphosphooligosaccharide--protein glycosyltransferase subunit 2-like [Pollicipes pollicipes]|uniref:dolichyl-diphosphooligosaccharide--protein glycosyltransferase subunit 2-like n=1 Tax=Pollicipes pollicipes TaxID=41117 RepID=UPI001884EE42|nr:dolichyl-diphosphooligosaccharide--protein glycosyltransferase subunit 2-like [Pollicipes pollicipes]
MSLFQIFVLLFLVGTCVTLTPSTFLSTEDFKRLETLFEGHLSAKKDVQSVYYGALGSKLIGKPIPHAQEVCRYLKSQVDTDATNLFFVAKAAAALPGCKLTVPADTVQALQRSVGDKAQVSDLYHAVGALRALSEKINSKAVSQALQAALKKDDGVLNLGYAFHLASELDGELAPFLDRIEDAVVQADEVDQKYLQYEGGVGITSTIVTGAYRLAEKANKRPAITDEQAIKFANYLVNRKSIQSLKGAYHLLNGLTMFCSNKFHLPVVMSLASPAALSSARPRLAVQVTDLLGRPLTHDLTLLADSATRLQDDAVVISKSPFAPSKADKSLFELDMLASTPGRGFYRLVVSARPSKPDARLIGHTGAELRVKVLTQMTVDAVELGVVDADQTTAPRTNRLVQHSKLGSVLEADTHQKLLLKFTILDKQTKKPMRCHQAFVRLAHKETGDEVVFVAEPDASLVYKFDMEVGAQTKKFAARSGAYEMQLIVGDPVVDNAFSWTMADVVLQFAEAARARPADLYQPKPAIRHEFRAPEPRPSAVISTVFTALVAVPLLVMLLLWARIGINVSHFPISLSAVGFLAGIGGIFALYYCFWLQLNMFATVKYLFGLGVVTFLCGHDALARLAAQRKQKV